MPDTTSETHLNSEVRRRIQRYLERYELRHAAEAVERVMRLRYPELGRLSTSDLDEEIAFACVALTLTSG